MRTAWQVLGLLLAAVAAVSGLVFVGLVLGGVAGSLEHERFALVPLIAGLAAAAVHGHRRGHLSRTEASLAAAFLAVWVLSLRFLK